MAVGQVFVAEHFYAPQVFLKWLCEAIRGYRNPVLVSLCNRANNLALGKINFFDPQSHTFH
jgi:hypothetical protein